MPRTTTLHKAEIVRKYESGESVQALADSYGRSYATMRENLVRWGASLRRRGPPRTYGLREDFFAVIDTEEKAYWLGFAFADGSVVQTGAGNWTFRVELKWPDRKHLHKLTEAMQTDSPVKQGRHRDKRTGRPHKSAYICICSARLCRDLIQLGCIPNKTCRCGESRTCSIKTLRSTSIARWRPLEAWLLSATWLHSDKWNQSLN